MSPKMLQRIALALVLALLAWGGLALGRRNRSDDTGALVLPALDPASVTEIALRKGTDTIVLSRQGAAWTVNGFPAAPQNVQTFLGAARDSSARSEVVAERPASHQRLGVDSATGRRLTMTAGTKAVLDLWLGNRGPDFEGFYVRPVGSDVAYLLRGRFAELTVQGVPEWRDKQIASFLPDSVGRVQIARGKTRWTLLRNGAAWKLAGGAADSTRVARFLAHLANLRAAGFPEPAELDSIHLQPPDRSLAVYSAGGHTLLALAFDSTRSGSYWVRSMPDGLVYRLDGPAAELATPAESTLRK